MAPHSNRQDRKLRGALKKVVRTWVNPQCWDDPGAGEAYLADVVARLEKLWHQDKARGYSREVREYSLAEFLYFEIHGAEELSGADETWEGACEARRLAEEIIQETLTPPLSRKDIALSWFFLGIGFWAIVNLLTGRSW